MGRVVRESMRHQLFGGSASGHASGFCALAKTPTARVPSDTRPSGVGVVAAAKTARRIWRRWPPACHARRSPGFVGWPKRQCVSRVGGC